MDSQLLNVDFISQQHAKDGPVRRNAVATDRNNLTALSQNPNLDLYFVAEFEDIVIFRPKFPTHQLTRFLYQWRLPVSQPNLRGYINSRRPHCVNSLLVAWLGRHEVLICACDDGDIIVYYIHDVLDFAKKAQPGRKSKPRHLFLGNVGRSAWGLAVHTNARKIAVSSNTHAVTVYSYALSDDSVLYDRPDEWQYPGRDKDDLLTLNAHHYNIPSVGFFNSDWDKEGRWLVSTDLIGIIVVWDLRDRCERSRIHPHESSILPNPHTGWSVSCIDRQAFLLVKSAFDWLGCQATKDSEGTYDITIRRNTSVVMPGIERLNDNSSSNTAINLQQVQDVEETRIDDERIAAFFAEGADSDDESGQDQYSSDLNLPETDMVSSSAGSWASSGITRDMNEENYRSPSSGHRNNLEASKGGRPLQRIENKEPDAIAPFILVHTGSDYLTMQKAPFISLTVVSRNPCHQLFTLDRTWLIPHDHLRLTRIIPELNVFITATPAGRVAIYTLTRRMSNVNGRIHDHYGMRLERVVPAVWTSKVCEEPARLLIGIATAPIQNSRHPRTTSGRRWRLCLTYHDYTIANYELTRQAAAMSSSSEANI